MKTRCHLPQNPIAGAPRTTSGGPGAAPRYSEKGQHAGRREPTSERAALPRTMMLRLLATATAATALLFSPTPGVLVLSPALTGPRTTYIRQRVNQIVAARLESWPPRHRRGAGSTHRLVRAQVLRRAPRGRVVRARVEGRSPVLRLGPRAARPAGGTRRLPDVAAVEE